MTDFDASQAAQDSVQRGTFSFMDRLLGRNFPKSEIVVYLDEDTAFKRQALTEKKTADLEEAAKIQEQIDALDAQLAGSRYVFTLTGFDPNDYDTILSEIYAEYPAEYTEDVNPYSGAKVREEKPNEDRVKLLWAKLWARSITQIEGPDHTVDNSVLDVNTAGHMRGSFPIDGRRRIDIRIQELRMASSWMDEIQDEGFLATP